MNTMQNDNNITLRITSSQTDTQGEVETVEFFTEAKYYKKEGSQYITYKESEISGLEGTTSTLRISPEAVTLMRFGSVKSKMVFEEGRETRTDYVTGFGSFDLSVFTEKVDIGVCNNRLSSIYLKYMLKLNSHEHFTNEMNIRILKS